MAGSEIFFELGLIIVLAAVLGSIARMFKQPLILAYIIAGVIVGPAFLNSISATESVEALSTIGIAFLLFLVGLNLNTTILREVGKTSVITGIAQVVFTSVVGYGISILLGFGVIESIFIAIALTFSSTIIIIKLLGDKKDLNSLYGKISIGFLLVQDVIAIFILIFLSGLSAGGSLIGTLIPTVLKASLLIGLALLSGKIITPFIFPRAAKLSPELLFLTAIAWMFLLSMASIFMGLSVEIGAFLAGVGLASLPYVQNLQSRIKPLRDFFIILFFIHLGTSISLGAIQDVLIPALILSVFVLIGNPFIVMILMKYLGYTKRTGLLTGLTVSQISEFSLIIVALGFSLGTVSSQVVTLATLVGIITITISTYMITYSEFLYDKIKGLLRWFEPRKLLERKNNKKDIDCDIVLIGSNRIGSRILNLMSKELLKKTLVVDINPKIVKKLDKKMSTVYGDVDDIDIQEIIKDSDPKIIISTVHGINDNLQIIRTFKKRGRYIILTVGRVRDAIDLYKEGADYVIVPQATAGKEAFHIIDNIFKKKNISNVRKEKIKILKKLEKMIYE